MCFIDSISFVVFYLIFRFKHLMLSFEMFQKLEHMDNIDAVELNLSCPNIVGKPQMGYDMGQMKECLDTLSPYFHKRPVGVKLPPYFDMIHFKQTAELLNQYPIRWVPAL